MAKSKITGISADLKRLMLRDPSVTADSLMKKLAKKGYEPKLSSVQTLRSDFLHSLKILIEQSALTPELIERINKPADKAAKRQSA